MFSKVEYVISYTMSTGMRWWWCVAQEKWMPSPNWAFRFANAEAAHTYVKKHLDSWARDGIPAISIDRVTTEGVPVLTVKTKG